MPKSHLIGLYVLLLFALPSAAQQIVYGSAKALAEERGDTVSTLRVERRTLNQLYLMGGARSTRQPKFQPILAQALLCRPHRHNPLRQLP